MNDQPGVSLNGSAGKGKTYRLALRFRIFLLFGAAFFMFVVVMITVSIAVDPSTRQTSWLFVLWLIFVIGLTLCTLGRPPTRSASPRTARSSSALCYAPSRSTPLT